MSYQHRVESEQLRHKLNAALKRAEAAEARLAELVPDGWKLVPNIPTNEMMWAAKSALSSTVGWESFKEAYYGMLAAAPEVK